MTKKENFDKYLKTYFGKFVLEKYSLDTHGMWKISGEDLNCDLGGFHHNPHLEFVEGKLKDVMLYGCSLKGFWTWGDGGQFELIKINNIDIAEKNNKRKLEIQAEIKKLQKELSTL